MFIYRDKFTACKYRAVEKALNKRGPSEEPDGGDEHHAHLTPRQGQRETGRGRAGGGRSKAACEQTYKTGIASIFMRIFFGRQLVRWSTNNSGDDEGHHSNDDERFDFIPRL